MQSPLVSSLAASTWPDADAWLSCSKPAAGKCGVSVSLARPFSCGVACWHCCLRGTGTFESSKLNFRSTPTRLRTALQHPFGQAAKTKDSGWQSRIQKIEQCSATLLGSNGGNPLGEHSPHKRRRHHQPEQSEQSQPSLQSRPRLDSNLSNSKMRRKKNKGRQYCLRPLLLLSCFALTRRRRCTRLPRKRQPKLLPASIRFEKF